MCICINNILHLVLECLVPHQLGPHHQEPEYDHLLVVQSSGVDILVCCPLNDCFAFSMQHLSVQILHFLAAF